jgi:hypothetical protein
LFVWRPGGSAAPPVSDLARVATGSVPSHDAVGQALTQVAQYQNAISPALYLILTFALPHRGQVTNAPCESLRAWAGGSKKGSAALSKFMSIEDLWGKKYMAHQVRQRT